MSPAVVSASQSTTLVCRYGVRVTSVRGPKGQTVSNTSIPI